MTPGAPPIAVAELREADRPALRRLYAEARRRLPRASGAESAAGDDFDSATQGELVLVARRGGRVVGFVSAWQPEHFIHLLFVAQGEERSGVGSALLAACLARVGRPATLKCLQSNAGALAFYHRRGWEIVAPGRADDGPYFLMKREA